MRHLRTRGIEIIVCCSARGVVRILPLLVLMVTLTWTSLRRIVKLGEKRDQEKIGGANRGVMEAPGLKLKLTQTVDRPYVRGQRHASQVLQRMFFLFCTI